MHTADILFVFERRLDSAVNTVSSCVLCSTEDEKHTHHFWGWLNHTQYEFLRSTNLKAVEASLSCWSTTLQSWPVKHYHILILLKSNPSIFSPSGSMPSRAGQHWGDKGWRLFGTIGGWELCKQVAYHSKEKLVVAYHQESVCNVRSGAAVV